MRTVHTVLGPVPADQLGAVAVHESLLSVLPGAEHAFDVTIDRAEIFETLAKKLTDFRNAGGGTVVDVTGMFHGRDLPLLEALSRSTGVHVVASTGMGPEELLGGYFLTPQTNPPTPWPADRFAALFGAEVTAGMAVPRVERRAPAGLVVTAVTRIGRTATDESLLRGAARTARATGVPVAVCPGDDALGDLEIVLEEGVAAERVAVAGLDRRDVARETVLAVVRRGASVVLDHVGADDDEHLTDRERADLVLALVADGHAGRVLLSTGAIGVAKGLPDDERPLAAVLEGLVPLLRSSGLDEPTVHRLVVENPRDLLTVRPGEEA
ncbi:phosphotriesterase [Actinomycetospora termitidis]|uniref:Phosphotriesterase n=1 Tax=Actinomycetospora termitidis TaxID=3053470 RepID=A0ABT7M4N4_9PSEU|nr:phosphotriesterase [Actinomycetospora sp. Odt1-22]MDL5155640.1 phosphotriesterase [Actinomycetospora sp. Odt1-22]